MQISEVRFDSEQALMEKEQIIEGTKAEGVCPNQNAFAPGIPG
jgi:hypothetical protein